MLSRLDNRLLYAMRTRCHGPVMESIAVWLGRIGAYAAVWVSLAILFAIIDPDRRGEWLAAGFLGPLAIGINYAVKLIVRRQRPLLADLPPLGGAPSSLSFPSAHTASSFAVVTAMTRIEPACAVLFALAIAIGLCRPYLGMHYPSDVLGGAVLGVALGLALPLGAFS